MTSSDPAPFPIKISYDQPPPPAPEEKGDKKRYDDFYPAWENFLALESRRAKKTSAFARAVAREKAKVSRTSAGDGLKVKHNSATRSYDDAKRECSAKVEAIIAECKRLNRKYLDTNFDMQSPWCLSNLAGDDPEAYRYYGEPGGYKRIEDIYDNPQFIVDGATADDVHQGRNGDCWFLASLMAASAKKELIERLCVAKDEKIGVYGFVFFRDGEWIHEVIDDRLFLKIGDDDMLTIVRDWDKYERFGMRMEFQDDKLKAVLQKGAEALYFAHCKSDETWVPLIEKAYAKAHGDYCVIEGGWPSEGIEDITGGVSVNIKSEDIMNKDRFWSEQLMQVNDKYLFGGGSRTGATNGFVSSHAYTVMRVWEKGDLRLVKLRNPWGKMEWKGDWADGGKLWTLELMAELGHAFGDDGVFWITYAEFLKQFPNISRVRLFDDTWSVAQKWTAVNVPWTVDYLDVKFQFTLMQQGPVVIVLSQPDERYFRGLRGRFEFALHFRVYRAKSRQQVNDDGGASPDSDPDPWIVRSMHTSGGDVRYTRSVSADIEDLAPGTYDVVFKITPSRDPYASTAQENIAKFAVERKEKLLSVGRCFDYAQSKGNLKALEEANRRSTRKNDRQKEREQLVVKRKINQLERKRAMSRRKRIDDAMKKDKKEFEAKMKEWRKKRAEAKKAYKQAKSNATKPTEPAAATNNPDVPDAQQKTQVSPLSEDLASLAVSSTAATASEPQPTSTRANPADDQVQAVIKPDDLNPQDSLIKSAPADPVATEPPTTLPETDTADDTDSDFEFDLDPPSPPPEAYDDDDFDWDEKIDAPVTLADIGIDQSQPNAAIDALEPPFEKPRAVERRQRSLRPGASADAGEESEQEVTTAAMGDFGEVSAGVVEKRKEEKEDEGDDEDDDDDDEENDEDLDIFKKDPWNAKCVLGLRVYAQEPAVGIEIVRE